MLHTIILGSNTAITVPFVQHARLSGKPEYQTFHTRPQYANMHTMARASLMDLRKVYLTKTNNYSIFIPYMHLCIFMQGYKDFSDVPEVNRKTPPQACKQKPGPGPVL
jgi:hypothetical protein